MRLITSKDLRYGDFVVQEDSTIAVCNSSNYASLVIGRSMIYILTYIEIKSVLSENEKTFESYVDYLFSISNSKLPASEVNSIKRDVTNSLYGVRDSLFPLILLKNYDIRMFRHSLDVMLYAVKTAEMLGVSGIMTLTIGGIFHDIGKLGVPLSILEKPGRLTDEEFDVIKQHPTWGYEIMKNSLDDDELEIILNHHRKLDGSGYPDSSMKLSERAELVTVCDMFDAIVSKRSYKSGESTDKAFSILMEDANKGKINKDFVGGLKRMVSF